MKYQVTFAPFGSVLLLSLLSHLRLLTAGTLVVHHSSEALGRVPDPDHPRRRHLAGWESGGWCTGGPKDQVHGFVQQR